MTLRFGPLEVAATPDAEFPLIAYRWKGEHTWPLSKNARRKPAVRRPFCTPSQHAQDIWKEMHDSAVKEYGEDGRAHRVAYASLKHQYQKKGDKWVKKQAG